MPTARPLGFSIDSADELLAGLHAEFPSLHFACHSGERGHRLVMESEHGARVDVDVAYPTDVDAAYDTARDLLRDHAVRDQVADLLIGAMGGYRAPDGGHAAYIVRWLVLSQRVMVTLGDDPSIEPVLRSPSLAVLHAPSRRLKLWADGAAVLHFDEPTQGDVDPQESRGLDLSGISLREFQDSWVSTPTAERSADCPAPPVASPSSAAEAAAIRLLVDYDDGAWLRHHRFAVDVRAQAGADGIDWAAASHLSTISTEATLQDRAVLTVACHLSGHVNPDATFADGLHFVGSARDLVLRVIEELAGAHPDPDRGWPSDCSPACP